MCLSSSYPKCDQPPTLRRCIEIGSNGKNYKINNRINMVALASLIYIYMETDSLAIETLRITLDDTMDVS
jgi:hypothetical protein